MKKNRNTCRYSLQALLFCLIAFLIVGCADSPSENKISSLLKDHFEKAGNYKITSLKVISIKENKLMGQFNKNIFGGGKAYLVEVEVSLEALKDVSLNPLMSLYKKGQIINSKGNFTVTKREGSWVMEFINFDKMI